ncbi:family 43 glycosylhydrolase [Terribacillus halophilus]|uniref:family 43 glycosylhydrolase n=1 Tax=Terribacillus halophilus TaxID=361279 RepID=UPI000984E381|nr:family 43 glycosylhydrolase [Terribacillus halophilus]
MKTKNRLLVVSMLSAVMLIPTLPGADTFAKGKGGHVETPVFENASVHDPSVIEVDDQYYVFGSHLAAAKTNDLMKWKMVDSGVRDGNKLIPNVTEELKETLDWAQTDTLWAADVIQLADGKFYMYYNACKGDSPRSAMGVAVADNIEGPYEDTGIILKSGMWDEPSEDGTIYDGTKHPNVVDPDVFYDKDGKLWMVYGSYSGGIFIMEMDEKTGKPLPGQGYGKKLMGGNHSRIEGPAMMYSPETDYYYMFLSFGGLDSFGGYNIRAVRSESPDGPFYDAEGNDMTDVKADPTLPLFDDKSIEPYGVKLLGNNLFEKKVGDPGEEPGIGYVSPGHNTAFYDEDTKNHYLIFHSRFPDRGEEHEVRVHQMHMNKDGWPVVAPSRNTNETEAKIKLKDMAGDYQYVNHGKDISADVKTSEQITLKKNGKVEGAIEGKWKRGKNNEITLTIEGEKYSGFFLKQWDEAAQQYDTTFTALSDKGVAVWGNRMEDMKDKEIVAAVKEDLEIPNSTNLYQSVELPTEGTHESRITWTSSNSDVIEEDGTIHRPEAGSGDGKATLTAKIQAGKKKAMKSFQVTVKQQASEPEISQYNFDHPGSREATDASGNNLAALLKGNAVQTADGKLALDGKDSYVELSPLAADAEDFTFAALVNWQGGAAWQRIFDIGASNGQNMFLTPSDGSGKLRFTINDGADQNVAADTTLPVNEWVHLAVTLEGNTGKLYVNGELAGTNENITANPSDILGDTNYLGKSRYSADPFFGGQMDEVVFYREALDNAEIESLVK